MSRVIVNIGVGGGYSKGTQRLRGDCQRYGVPFIGYTDWPPGCPTHRSVPYGFKPWLMRKAQQDGYSTVLWVDSSGTLQRDPVAIFDPIEKDGYFISGNYGHKCGRWTSDDTLAAMGRTRDEIADVEHCSALIFGVSFAHPVGVELFERWERYSKDGVSFAGAAKSADPRFTAHRHDQAVLSILAWEMGLKLTPAGGDFLDYGSDRPLCAIAAYPNWK